MRHLGGGLVLGQVRGLRVVNIWLRILSCEIFTLGLSFLRTTKLPFFLVWTVHWQRPCVFAVAMEMGGPRPSYIDLEAVKQQKWR